jgi:pilus assembly protein CpaF
VDNIRLLKIEVKQGLRNLVVDRGISLKGRITPEQKEFLEVNIKRVLPKFLKKYKIKLNRAEIDNLAQDIVSEFTGYGVIEPFLRDPLVTDIMVNSPEQIFVERQGRLERVDAKFDNKEEVMRVIEKMVADSGKRLDLASPFVDLKIAPQQRATLIIPPISSRSPSFCIRKAFGDVFAARDLLAKKSITPQALQFLRYCVRARLNILVAGSTGVGKTTFLNALIKEFIPDYARIVVIEETEEIVMDETKHHLKLVTRPPNIEGRGEVKLEDLVRLALRVRPDRIIIGEVLGSEAFHFLHAANTGHEGSMCTIHANNSADAIMRLETLAMMSEYNLSQDSIQRFLTSGIDLIVHMQRLSNGKRAVSQISEFDYQDNRIVVDDIFSLKRAITSEGEDYQLVFSGHTPSFIERLKVKTQIPDNFFQT